MNTISIEIRIHTCSDTYVRKDIMRSVYHHNVCATAIIHISQHFPAPISIVLRSIDLIKMYCMYAYCTKCNVVGEAECSNSYSNYRNITLICIVCTYISVHIHAFPLPPLPHTRFHVKDDVNALHLAICGNHPDIVKVLVDEFNVALMVNNPVSIPSQLQLC